jgi:hypothetical protein
MRSTRLILLLALVLMGTLMAAPAQAAPQTEVDQRRTQCIPTKHIQNWHSVEQLYQGGFNTVAEGDLATVGFDGNLLLNLAGGSANNQAQTSRVTEIDADLPIAQRVKCWQASSGQDVVVEFRERFNESGAPQNLQEDLFLWNAPLPGPNNPEPPQLLTAIGVSRTSAFGAPIYIAEIVQDLDVMTFNGFFQFAPLPDWLDAAEWHNVRITLSEAYAKIEVAQGDHPFKSVLQVGLPHPAEPLGFEFSVESSGQTVPADGLNVSCLDIRNVPSNVNNLPVRPSRCHN